MALPRRAALIDKAALRARLRAARDAFVLDAAPSPIEPPPEWRALLRSGTTIASYAPIGSEAAPPAFETAARAAGCRFALPFTVDRATPLRFLVWAEGLPLTPGPYGLHNPPPDAKEVSPDIILTPLVGFDRALNRLGQGAGHYDRAFAAHPHAVRIGLAWAMQEVDVLPADPWDVPLHALATEREWITA